MVLEAIRRRRSAAARAIEAAAVLRSERTAGFTSTNLDA
jgi:hypothetical protein